MANPSYVALHEKGQLLDRVVHAVDGLKKCRHCPRECGVNRLEGELGYCRTGRSARVAHVAPHFGEERPLVGRHGSGTIFLSSCNLLCTFCQNHETSFGNIGENVDAAKLAGMMVQLQRLGCHNINFVTPSHGVPQILEALIVAIESGGLNIPLVYNTGGYDSVETLKLLDGVIDIYMPDFKFWDNERAEQYCKAPDYRERAMDAVHEMHRQVGDLQIDGAGTASRGLLVRHLVMPNGIAGTAEIMNFLASEISEGTFVSVMRQYHPCGVAEADVDIGRGVSKEEFRQALVMARVAGLRRLGRE